MIRVIKLTVILLSTEESKANKNQNILCSVEKLLIIISVRARKSLINHHSLGKK